MTDRELLEKAAKAARFQWNPTISGGALYGCFETDAKQTTYAWNPLTDDGDALRLMAQLNINVYYRENINGAFVIADHEGIQFCPESLDGPHEDVATRRAIVRAAAALASE